MGANDDTAQPEPRFDAAVPDTGYRWWYVDGISDDGKNGIVVIAFIGSVFSPYYFSARARGHGNPYDFCSINVGLYRQRGKLWAMTERDQGDVSQSATRFDVGPSSLRWEADQLIIDISERSTPFARRLVGRVVVKPQVLNDACFSLDPDGRHTWRPISPIARVEVDMDTPEWRWQGDAYFDTNYGIRPLEEDFLGWNWSRHSAASRASITYAADLVGGGRTSLALAFEPDGSVTHSDVPPEIRLPGTGWRIDRRTRSAVDVSVYRTLEDTPFYARSILQTSAGDKPSLVMHESLSLSRFKSGWVRRLLPFRMPRVRSKQSDS